MEKKKYIGRKALAFLLALVMVVSSLAGLTGCNLFGSGSVAADGAQAKIASVALIEAWNKAKNEAKDELREWYKTNITNTERLSLLFWDANEEVDTGYDTYYYEYSAYSDAIWYAIGGSSTHSVGNFTLDSFDLAACSSYSGLDYFSYYILDDYSKMDYTPKYTAHRALIEIPNRITEFFGALDSYVFDQNEIASMDDIPKTINRIREECGIYVGESDVTFEGIPTYEEDQQNNFEEFYVITNGDLTWFETSYDWYDKAYSYRLTWYDNSGELFAEFEITGDTWYVYDLGDGHTHTYGWIENSMGDTEYTEEREIDTVYESLWPVYEGEVYELVGLGGLPHKWEGGQYILCKKLYDWMRNKFGFYCSSYTNLVFPLLPNYDTSWDNCPHISSLKVEVCRGNTEHTEYEDFAPVEIRYSDIFNACYEIFADDQEFMKLYNMSQFYYDVDWASRYENEFMLFCWDDQSAANFKTGIRNYWRAYWNAHIPDEYNSNVEYYNELSESWMEYMKTSIVEELKDVGAFS